MTTLWLFIMVAGTSYLLTWVFRNYALTRSLVDIPNERSSHSIPTPRGGGIAVAVSFLAVLPLLVLNDLMTSSVLYALLGSGAWVAIVGLLDDHGHLAVRWRLLAHFIAAAWALIWLGGLPPLLFFGFELLETRALGIAFGIFYLVWLLNLYNFMDGIDGIASVEAISVSIGGAFIYILLGEFSSAIAPLVLAVAVSGFLFWNFPPARVFLGDVGSSFLGIILGILSLQAAWIESRLLWSWLILLGVFIVDATWTLFRRLLRGDRVYKAHRNHAYQHASRRMGKHLPVTLIVAALNFFWLLPMAVMVGVGVLDGTLGLVLAYVPLILLVLRFKAGKPSDSV